MGSSQDFMRGFLLLAILQGYCWAQRHRLDSANPFEGVRYLNSRVAAPPRSRNILNKTRPSWGGSYPTIIRTSSPTFTVSSTSTTTPRSTQYWNPPVTPSTTPLPTSTSAQTRPPHRQYFESIQTHAPRTTTTPRMKIEREPGDTPGYLVTIEENRPRKHNYHGRYNPHVKPDRYSEAESDSSSEYRGVKEGSYYDRSGVTAPKEDRDTVFDWDVKRAHRHRHHHGSTSPALPAYPLRYTDQTSYEAFESRGATYSPTPTTRRSHRRQSTTPQPPQAPTTTRYRRQENSKMSSVSYHQRQRERPSSAVRHTSESVSYVSGSYFPTAGGSRKPAVHLPRPQAIAVVTTTPSPVWHHRYPDTTRRYAYLDTTTRRPEDDYDARRRLEEDYDARRRHQYPDTTTRRPEDDFNAGRRHQYPDTTTRRPEDSYNAGRRHQYPDTTTRRPEDSYNAGRRHQYPDTSTAGRHKHDYDTENHLDDYDEAGGRRHDGVSEKTRDDDEIWNDNVHPFASFSGKF